MDKLILRDYQVEGVSWLCFLWGVGLSGVLSDDMGLGKTVQCLMGMVVRGKEKEGRKVRCVVCACVF